MKNVIIKLVNRNATAFCTVIFLPYKRITIIELIIKYFTKNNVIKKEFEKVYKLTHLEELSEIILQSIIASYAIDKNLYSVNIFLDKGSILYLDKEYPFNYNEYIKEKDKNLLDYINFINGVIALIKDYFNKK